MSEPEARGPDDHDFSSVITLAKAWSAIASISSLVRFWMGWGT
jgi:hypothetical protein